MTLFVTNLMIAESNDMMLLDELYMELTLRYPDGQFLKHKNTIHYSGPIIYYYDEDAMSDSSYLDVYIYGKLSNRIIKKLYNSTHEPRTHFQMKLLEDLSDDHIEYLTFDPYLVEWISETEKH